MENSKCLLNMLPANIRNTVGIRPPKLLPPKKEVDSFFQGEPDHPGYTTYDSYMNSLV